MHVSSKQFESVAPRATVDEPHLSRNDGDSAFSFSQWQLMQNVVEEFKPIKKKKTVVFSIAKRSSDTASNVKQLPIVAESLEDAGKDTPTVARGALRAAGTTLSRFVTYDGDNGAASNRLNDAIYKTSQARTHRRQDGFVPEKELEQILNENAILQELIKIEQSVFKRIKFWRKTRSSQELQQETKVICGEPLATSLDHSRDCITFDRYRKIFAILLLISRPGAIRKFIREGLCDAHLPLVKTPVERKVRSFTLCVRGAGNNIDTSFLLDWKRHTVVLFEQTQWMVLAHCFDGGKPHDIIILPDETIIPFTYQEYKYTGAHGEIHKIGIHPEHHNFEERKGAYAMKMVHRKSVSFQNELRMLKRTDHRHIVPLLATFHHRDDYNFIFPWAKCDLTAYWRSESPNPLHDSTTLLWVARQCEGIAEALYFVHRHYTSSWSSLFGTNITKATEAASRPHRFYGLHGDLKPANILWFPDDRYKGGMGILKISDFGAGEFSGKEHRWRPSDRVPHTAEYQPPECSLPESVINISYAFDVWTLGCLYLELVTWYIGGWEELAEFQKLKRRSCHGVDCQGSFFQTIDDNGEGKCSPQVQIKPVVTEHLNKLRNSPDSCTLIRGILDMVQDDMLIIQPYSDGHVRGRKTCHQVQLQLGTMIDDIVDQQRKKFDSL
ncbi:kinase-like domain-containing protein [Nemania serpens]|nr:kinase-like domain-containing protein [Nemania serpens]